MQSIDMLVDATQRLASDGRVLAKASAGVVRGPPRMAVGQGGAIGIERALRAVNFNVLTERAGTDTFLRQAGMHGDTTTLFGLVAWLVIVAALITAFNGMGLTYLPDLLGRVVLFAPQTAHRHADHCIRLVLRAFRRRCRAELFVDAQIADADVLGRLVRSRSCCLS